MTNRYILAAAAAIVIVLLSYVLKFYYSLGYVVSDDTEVWGQLGDYAGGLLNPILSFIALVLLIKSLTLQNDTNESLRSELINKEKSEKLRSFETLFFSMINSQKELYDSFKIDFKRSGVSFTKSSIDAVMEIEDEIESMVLNKKSSKDVQEFLENIDSKERIFDLTRAFYIIVKMTSEKLNDAQGFSKEDRESHLLTLVNFTNFSQLRLIMIALQFMDYPSVDYLKNNKEFNDILAEVGLDYNLY